MQVRSLAVMLAVTMTVSPSFAQADQKDSKKPTFVIQAQPISKILDDVKTAAKSVVGPEAADSIDMAIKEQLGEKGFSGIDLLRPLAGYVNITGRAIEDPSDISGVLIVPVTDEKDFIDLIKRMKLDVEPIKGQEGLYGIYPPAEVEEMKIRLRVVERNAFIGVNIADENMTAAKFLSPADLIDPADRGLFTMISYIGQMPKEYIEQQNEQYDQLIGTFKNLPLPVKAKDALTGLMESVVAMNNQMYKEGEVTTARVLYERTTNELVYETTIKAKNGTPLAKEIASRKPTSNRFANLIPKNATAGVLMQAPLFSKDLHNAASAGLEFLAEMIREENPPPEDFVKVYDAVMAGLARTLKSGDLDMAAAIESPTKDGTFGILAAITFDDPSKVEKEVRALHENAPDGVKALVKLDAAKVGNVSIHEAKVGAFMPAEPKKVFGENASLCIAFAPKAVYVAFGPSAMDSIKAAITAKPGAARAFDVAMSPAKLAKFVGAIEPQAGMMMPQILGKEDELISMMFMEVEGGNELVVRMGMNMKVIGGFVAGITAVGAEDNETFREVGQAVPVAPPPPPPAPVQPKK
jgi:hypothetical protein